MRAVVPWPVRFPTMANHTATHVLHECLREVLGDHVKQAGSAVRPDKLRFDFTHPQALTADERAEIEQRVNERIFANLPVRIFETPIAEARKLGAHDALRREVRRRRPRRRHRRLVGRALRRHARALDGGDRRRSRSSTRGSVGSGARRIEAVTAGEAFAYLHERAREAEGLRARARARAQGGEAPAAKDERRLRRSSTRSRASLFVEAKAVKGGPLRDLSDRLRQQEKADGAIVASVDDGRAYLVINLDESLVQRGLDATALVRELGKHIGGGGGGKPTLAEAGGKNPDGVRDALAAGKQAVAAALA